MVSDFCTLAALPEVFTTAVVVLGVSPIKIVFEVPSGINVFEVPSVIKDVAIASVPVIVPIPGPRLSTANKEAFDPS